MEIIATLLASKLIKSIVTLIGGLVVSVLLHGFLGLFLRTLSHRSRLAAYQQRLETLKTLLNSVISFVVFFVVLLMIVANFGFNITPLLTGAGIVGLAVSLSAQTVIKDVIAGALLIMENQYNVGDKIQIGDIKGTVRQVNLRTTVIKGEDGGLTFIPNSEIKQVTLLPK